MYLRDAVGSRQALILSVGVAMIAIGLIGLIWV